MAPDWRVEHQHGDAGEFHARPLGDRRLVTFFAADRATLVLGSAQRVEDVDHAEAERRGVAVVRRRSGGGGVLLLPGEHIWMDIEIPAGDPLWVDDVGRAAWWVGELWRDALAGDHAGLSVHHGRLQPSPWSAAVCFAGVGPGEVVDARGAKLVGLSQRRTRTAARFQTMVHLVWRANLNAALVAEPRPPGQIGAVAVTPGPAGDVVDRLVDRLVDRST